MIVTVCQPIFGPVSGPVFGSSTESGMPTWSPLSLFGAGELGAWYDPSDMGTLFQDEFATTPVTASGQPVGFILDKSGRGNHAFQPTAGSRPTFMEVGGLRYLLFDGFDDYLLTGSFYFETDKLTAHVGVRKGSDAAIGAIVELSDNPTLTTGSFALHAPGAPSTATYLARSVGTAGVSHASAASYTAPISNVLTMRADIAAPLLALSVNGSESTSASSQGTGTYGLSHLLYIGARAGTSLRFTGSLYGLIVRGAASTPSEATSAERYLASRSGVTLP